MVSQVSGLQNASNSKIVEFVVAGDVKCMRVVLGSLQCWVRRDCWAVLDGSYYFSYFFPSMVNDLSLFSPPPCWFEETGFIVRNGLWFVDACWGYLNVNVSRNSSTISMFYQSLFLWLLVFSWMVHPVIRAVITVNILWLLCDRWWLTFWWLTSLATQWWWNYLWVQSYISHAWGGGRGE